MLAFWVMHNVNVESLFDGTIHQQTIRRHSDGWTLSIPKYEMFFYLSLFIITLSLLYHCHKKRCLFRFPPRFTLDCIRSVSCHWGLHVLTGYSFWIFFFWSLIFASKRESLCLCNLSWNRKSCILLNFWTTWWLCCLFNQVNLCFEKRWLNRCSTIVWFEVLL